MSLFSPMSLFSLLPSSFLLSTSFPSLVPPFINSISQSHRHSLCTRRCSSSRGPRSVFFFFPSFLLLPLFSALFIFCSSFPSVSQSEGECPPSSLLLLAHAHSIHFSNSLLTLGRCGCPPTPVPCIFLSRDGGGRRWSGFSYIL
ncbi:MAG: hypothetical protein BYD32DRAFT_426173, partial [Podila humilis]